MRFRKIAFAIACLLPGFAASAFAYGTWGVGPLGGVNLSTADIGGQDSRSLVGWSVGARVEMGVNRLLSLSLDPMLVRHVAKYEPDGGQYHGRAQFHFLEVPLLLKGRVGFANVEANAFAGPRLTYLYDVTGRFAPAMAVSADNFDRYGLSGEFGLGMAFGIAPFVQLTGDARYTYGFTNLMDKRVGDVSGWRANDVRLVLGVLLNSGR